MLAFHESLGNVSGFYLLFDLYCACMKDLPRKVMWNVFFDRDFDFSMVFDKFKRALTSFATSLLVFSSL